MVVRIHYWLVLRSTQLGFFYDISVQTLGFFSSLGPVAFSIVLASTTKKPAIKTDKKDDVFTVCTCLSLRPTLKICTTIY